MNIHLYNLRVWERHSALLPLDEACKKQHATDSCDSPKTFNLIVTSVYSSKRTVC